MNSKIDTIKLFFTNPYYGFTNYDSKFRDKHIISQVKKFIYSNDQNIITDFEQKFSKHIGGGSSISFAAGRMGFFALMDMLGIKKGDEVIIESFNCVVMINAVLRIGAKPVFADIDKASLGSSINSIKKLVSNKTRMIVAQHSFGIPCEIQPIVNLAKKKNIFLLEDCALTMGSSIKGIKCGNFGDAALFSTDNTKLINTQVGGLIYSKNKTLISRLKKYRDQCSEISDKQKKLIFSRLIFDSIYCTPEKYGKYRIVKKVRNLFNNKNPYFEDDLSTSTTSSYPYPAKMPVFLAKIGILQLKEWDEEQNKRITFHKKMLDTIKNQFDCKVIQYSENLSFKIVPSRIVFTLKDNEQVFEKLKKIIEIESTWFTHPLYGATEPFENFGLKTEMCPNTFNVMKRIVNIPCNYSVDHFSFLCKTINKILKTK